MPTGDTERAFAEAAKADGIELERARAPWLNQRGHLGLPDLAAAAREPMAQIFAALEGVFAVQDAKRPTSLPGDFHHAASGTFIEIDESQHFTSFRLRTLELYPADARLGFDLSAYVALCKEWSVKSDKYRRSKSAPGFGVGGRQRQRAYYDALRDLVVPLMGYPPVVRVPAVEPDGPAAYAKVREMLSILRG